MPGADPFALSAERLLERIGLIKKYLPKVQVITMYARTDNIAAKSDADLRASAALENAIKPSKTLISTMSAFVGTPLDEAIKAGIFVQATEKENLEEEREFLAGLELPDCYFWAMHPLDTVKLNGILGEEKQQMLDALTHSLEHVEEGLINRTSRVGTL